MNELLESLSSGVDTCTVRLLAVFSCLHVCWASTEGEWYRRKSTYMRSNSFVGADSSVGLMDSLFVTLLMTYSPLQTETVGKQKGNVILRATVRESR